MQHKKANGSFYPLGAAAGLLNGFFGSGGGMVLVPMLKGLGVEAKQCHATSLMIVLPLTVASGFLYLKSGSFALSDTLVYLPGGLAGAVFGSWLLPRLKAVWLKRLFGGVVIFAGIRLLLR